jgi:hypothetical protein
MAERKRKTTAPLTDDDIAETLDDVQPEEFMERFDQIFSPHASLPGSLQELVTLDDYMERELREMFQSIVTQYVRPVQETVERIRSGEVARHVAEVGLEAIAPIVSAAESLKYSDISELLREIQRPLADLREGNRRKLTKKETAAISGAWDRLSELLQLSAEGAPASDGFPVPLGAIVSKVDGVTAAHVRSLLRAGLSSIRDVASAPADDVVEVTGIDRATAERIRAFASGAVAAAEAPHEPRAVPPGWMRVRIDSDVLKARLTFEYSVLGKHLEPILARLAEADAGAKPAPKPRAPRKKPSK